MRHLPPERAARPPPGRRAAVHIVRSSSRRDAGATAPPPGRRAAHVRASSSPDAGTTAPPPAALAARLDAARDNLAAAVAAEDYALAAALKKEVDALEAQDPVTVARKELEAAIAAERWDDAARARDALAALAPPPPPPYVPPSTRSEETTHGVTVRVKSFFVAAQSAPGASLYTFAYRINISLAADAPGPVQLLNRHWLIEDATGRLDELTTPAGSMEGSYGFVEVGADGAPGAGFDVAIAKFGLDVRDDEPPGGKF